VAETCLKCKGQGEYHDFLGLDPSYPACSHWKNCEICGGKGWTSPSLPMPHPPAPQPPPKPSELLTEFEFLLPRNMYAIFLYAGNQIPGYTFLNIFLPSGIDSAPFLASNTWMARIIKEKISRQIKIKAANQPPGSSSHYLKFYVRPGTQNEWIITVVGNSSKKAVCNLIINETGTYGEDYIKKNRWKKWRAMRRR